MTTNQTSVGSLLQDLASPDEAMRRKVLFQLAKLLDLHAIPAIQKAAADDSSMEVRYLARKLLALYEAKKPESRALIRPGSSSDLPSVTATSPDADLASTDPVKRGAALKACAATKDPKLLPAVLERAGYDENKNPIETVPEVRSLIPLVLIQLGGKSQASAVAAFLDDGDSRVRANTLAALKAIGDQDSWALIVKCVQDPDHRVKTAAIGALSKRGKVNLIQCCRVMIEKSGDQYWQKDSAVALLARFNLPEAVSLLESVLTDPIPGVAQKAMKGLERLAEKGCEAARAALETASLLSIGKEHPEDFLKLEYMAHGVISASAATAVQPQPGSRTQDLALIVHGDDGALPRLLEQIREEMEVSTLVGILRALGRIGNDVVIPVLKDFLTHDAEEVRGATVDALGALGTDEVLHSVMPALRDKSAAVVARAVLALRSHPYLDLGKPIAELAGHADPARRRIAVTIITELSDPGFEGLLGQLSNDSDLLTARAAKEALTKPRPATEPATTTKPVPDSPPPPPTGSAARAASVAAQPEPSNREVTCPSCKASICAPDAQGAVRFQCAACDATLLMTQFDLKPQLLGPLTRSRDMPSSAPAERVTPGVSLPVLESEASMKSRGAQHEHRFELEHKSPAADILGPPPLPAVGHNLARAFHAAEGAVQILLEQARSESSDPAVIGILRTLGHIGSPEAISVLEEFVTHCSDQVRAASVEVLETLREARDADATPGSQRQLQAQLRPQPPAPVTRERAPDDAQTEAPPREGPRATAIEDIATSFAYALDLVKRQPAVIIGGCGLVNLVGVLSLGALSSMPWFLCKVWSAIIGQTRVMATDTENSVLIFRGRGGDLLVIYLVGMIVGVLTLGLSTPWFLASLIRFAVDNTSVVAGPADPGR